MYREYYAHGKLMLTGEYFVLDGAAALALPTKLGQRLKVQVNDSNLISWKSIDFSGNVWFEKFWPLDLDVQPNDLIEQKLLGLLKSCKRENGKFLEKGVEVVIESEFNLNWGLGSSSTLVSLIAQWTLVDPFKLQFEHFGGSGYDIACATAEEPILYKKLPKPHFNAVRFSPVFSQNLHWVYQGAKQNSREAIAMYKRLKDHKEPIVARLDVLTQELLDCKSLERFIELIHEYEGVMASALGVSSINESFTDFNGVLKSCGAWGGDFMLAASREDEIKTKEYFKQKGLNTVLKYEELVEV